MSDDITDHSSTNDSVGFSDVSSTFKEKYRDFFELSPDAVVFVDVHGTLVDSNDRTFEWLGYNREEVVGKNLIALPFFTASTRAVVLKKFAERMLGGNIEPYDVEFVDKSGGKHIANIRGSVKKDEAGKIIGEIVLLTDVTRLREAEEKERKAEKLFRLIIEKSHDGFILVDREGAILFENAGAKRLLGFPQSKSRVGENAFQAALPEEEPAARRMFEKLMHDPGESVEGQFRMRRQDDDSMRWFEVVCTNFLDDPDIGAMVVNFRDTTDRKAIEEDLGLRTKALESAVNHVVITDKDGKIIWVNHAFTIVTGYQSAEAIGQNPRILKSEKQNKAFYEKMWQTIRSGDVWQGELVNKRKDGSLFTEEITITPVRNAKKEITHFIAIELDVSQRKRVEQELATYFQMSVDLLCLAQDGYFKRVSPSFSRVLGYEEQTLLTTPIVEFVHPDEREITAREMEKVGSGIMTTGFEHRFRCKDGSYRWLSWTASATPDGIMFAIAHDITERKKIQASMEERTRDLQRLNTLMVGREVKMVELKEEIKRLRQQLGIQEKTNVND